MVLALNTEIMIPEDAPVRLTKAVLEKLNYKKLYRSYSPRGRKSSVDPRVLFEVMVYGNQCGLYSSRKQEEACRYRVDFIWLLEEEPVERASPLTKCFRIFPHSVRAKEISAESKSIFTHDPSGKVAKAYGCMLEIYLVTSMPYPYGR